MTSSNLHPDTSVYSEQSPVANFREANELLLSGVEKFKQQDFGGAIADLRQALALKPNFAEAYTAWGNTCFAMKDYQSAIACFDQAIQLDPNLAIAYGSRGLAYYELGDKQQALDDLTQSIQLDPNLANSYYSRGEIHLELNHFSQAIADFDATIDLFLSGKTNDPLSHALPRIQNYYREGLTYKDDPLEAFIDRAIKLDSEEMSGVF